MENSPLTYQPFAEVPVIEELGKELRRNVPDAERLLSTLSGIGVIAAGLSRGGLARWLILAAGAALVGRGWSGHCPLYQQMDLDRRHAHS